jgi:hypothetical protein
MIFLFNLEINATRGIKSCSFEFQITLKSSFPNLSKMIDNTTLNSKGNCSSCARDLISMKIKL